MKEQTMRGIIQTLEAAIRIPSLLSEAKEGAPFGEDNLRALEYMLSKGKELGFKTKNVDGYAGHIEFGEGEQILGVLCHLDVVPAGSGWDYPPYELTEKDGMLYGRGVMDNKGSAVVCLFALKELADEGFIPKKRIRIILGCNEESGSDCVKYYKTKEQLPALSFVPDSDFPLINSEKCILRLEIKVPLSQSFKQYGVKLEGGLRLNMVPEGASLSFLHTLPQAQQLLALAKQNERCTVLQNNDEIIINAKGKSSHAKDPLDGINAVSILFGLLTGVEGLVEAKSDLGNCLSIFKNAALAQALNAQRECPKSGDVTVNLGICSTTKNHLVLGLDCRLPLVLPPQEMTEIVKNALGSECEVTVTQLVPLLYVDENSTLVRTLLNIYARHSGEKDPKPLYTGGGTYARELDNAVAFGATFENQLTFIHEPNECLSVENLVKMFDIYKDAIRELSSN